MAKISLEHLINLLNQLDKSCSYKYINPSTKRTLTIVGFTNHSFKYFSKGEDIAEKRSVTESNMNKILNAVSDLVPFSIDAIVNASGNWRAGFESILAYTSEFYTCKINNQKHLVWAPATPHEIGILCEWKDLASLRDTNISLMLQQNAFHISQRPATVSSLNELLNVLFDLYKGHSKNVARMFFGFKCKNIIEEFSLDTVLNRLQEMEKEDTAITKEFIVCGMELMKAAENGDYGLSIVEDSDISSDTEQQIKNSSTKKKTMKYELWNEAIKNYFFPADSENEVFISIDKESLVEYINENGILDEEISKVQKHQKESGRPIIDRRQYIWNDYLRLFMGSEVSKSAFFSKMKLQISMLDSDKLYMLFPYFALFTMPLANRPELHANNFYTRLSDFLIENHFIKNDEKVGTSDLADLKHPALKTLWLSLQDWALKNEHRYTIKHTFTQRNDYVAPFLAECLFTASRKEKFKMLFYKAGLTPNNDLDDESIIKILNKYYGEIDFDSSNWKDAKSKYLDIIVSTFKREYQKWDGNALVIKREGEIKKNEYAGTRQSFLLEASIYRGKYEFGLLPFLPDATYAEEFVYESIYGEYQFSINSRKQGDKTYWSETVAADINKGNRVIFKRSGLSRVELVYNPSDCELLQSNGSSFISTQKLIAGVEYLVLISIDHFQEYENWLICNDAILIKSHELSSKYNLYRIQCAKVEFQESSKSKLHFTNSVNAKAICNLNLGSANGVKYIFKGLKTYFEITGIDIIKDKPKARFTDEGQHAEEIDLEYEKETNLWLLQPTKNKRILSKKFQIFCNYEKISTETYQLIDFQLPSFEDFEEIAFNKYGEYDEDGKFRGLSVDGSFLHDVNFSNLFSHMAKDGHSLPKSIGNYENQDYIINMVSQIGKCDKSTFDNIILVLSMNQKIVWKRENRWALRDVINNYFRMGYINYVYHNNKHIIKVNKPTFVLLPPRIEKQKLLYLKNFSYKQQDGYWTVLLTGARSPKLIERLLNKVSACPTMSYEIKELNDNLMPQTIYIRSESLDSIKSLADDLRIHFDKCIYSNTLLKQIANVEQYKEHITTSESFERYDGIKNFEVVDYGELANSGKYRKAKEFSKDSAVVTYFPGSFRTKTIYWKQNKQYEVDKHWGHLIGMNDVGAKVFKYDELNPSISMPIVLQLPLLYARALTLITGEIPSIESGERSYSICENPYTAAVSITTILQKLGQ